MLEDKKYEIILGDSLKKLKELPDNCIQTCVTSPPYYGLRDYGTGHWEGGDPNCPHYRTSKYSENTATGHKHMMEVGEAVGDAIYKSVCPLCGAVRVDDQIGLEETPEEYINKLVAVFHEVKRVLKDDGTLWVNIGDSYATNSHTNHNFDYEGGRRPNNDNINKSKTIGGDIKQKDLVGIPWMLAFALRADGWYLRQDIIWKKTNCMPEPVKDRCVKSHEYIFLLSKQPQYYFDYKAIQTPSTETSKKRAEYGLTTQRPDDMNGHIDTEEMGSRFVPDMSNKRDVWDIPCSSYKEAHFATYPERLIEPCILAGSAIGDIVLDPFNGSGTTGAVAMKYGRKYIGVELNPDYRDLTINRFEKLDGVVEVKNSESDTIKVKKESLF